MTADLHEASDFADSLNDHTARQFRRQEVWSWVIAVPVLVLILVGAWHVVAVVAVLLTRALQ